MPFVEVFWRVGALTEETIAALVEPLAEMVARGLETVDPSHCVTPAMVDLRCCEIGPLDRVRSDLFITVLARREPARSVAASDLVLGWAAEVAERTGLGDVVVELVLTDHHSSFDYAALEEAP